MRLFPFVVGVAIAAPAFAQTYGNPGLLNAQDHAFVRELTRGGHAEIDFGQLAKQRGRNAAVREFGQRMVTDHSQAGEELARTLKEAGATTETDEALDAEHQKMRASLAQKSGAAFDKAYIKSQIDDHENASKLLEQEIKSGQNDALRTFAVKTLPAVLKHLEIARQIQADLDATTPKS